MRTAIAALGVVILAAACGPTAEEQRAMDQGKCSGFGFTPGSDAYAHCMMSVAQQRDAQQAADRRAAEAQAAADKRARDAQQAAKDAADRDAWDKTTGQGAYSSSSSPSPSSAPNPVDQVRDSITQDMQKIESGE